MSDDIVRSLTIAEMPYGNTFYENTVNTVNNANDGSDVLACKANNHCEIPGLTVE